MFLDRRGIVKMIKGFSEVIQGFVIREIEAVLDKLEVDKVERLCTKTTNQELKDELLQDWNTVLELVNEVEEKNIPRYRNFYVPMDKD